MDNRYSVKCTPEMPPDGGFANVGKVFCVLGIVNVKAEDAGRYSCLVQSPQQLSASRAMQIRTFGECFLHVEYCSSHRAFRVEKFILASTNNPKEITLNRFESFKLSCWVNQQNYTTDLNGRWKRSDIAVGQSTKVDALHNSFSYAVSSAQQIDGGIYQCVIISMNDGATVIDSGNATTVNIKCKHFVAYFFL